MTFRTCARRSEVLELQARGHWPHACPPELHAHLAECRSCGELLVVTQAFQRLRASAAAQAELPAPGYLWWRAQLRRRNAALERMAKPILGAYVFALSILAVAGAALAASQARQGFRWLDWMGQIQISTLHVESFSPSALVNAGGGLLVVIPVVATLALLSAVAVYLAVERQ
ncbi:MAG: hypothetical protein P4L26_00175 [Terracidiphilus sp.]|nr:hypothetical protein [Terracidiphilus sp.]